jgi:hypothetical protein
MKAIIVAVMALAHISIGARANAQVTAASEPIGYFVGEGDSGNGYRPSDRELAVWAIESWARQSSGGLKVRSSPEPDALIRVYWSEPGTQLFGEMRPLTVKGRRGAAVYIGTDMLALGPDIAMRARRDELWREAIVYLTCVHEVGHALGLPHTRDFRDIMYYFGYGGDIIEYFARYRRQLASRDALRAVSALSEADVQQLHVLFPSR